MREKEEGWGGVGGNVNFVKDSYKGFYDIFDSVVSKNPIILIIMDHIVIYAHKKYSFVINW